jgi:hypothetical protein
MSDLVRFKKSHVFGIVILSLLFVWFCVYGYFLLKEEPKPLPSPGTQECWDYYEKSGEKALEMCSLYE